ncbi:MAG: AAA family ATPase [Gammaproteobacteria bacterium]|nr:AAA family ATPase [Gammaproteobacteria bacterium]
MKSWKISRLQIQGFKAFSFVDFNFESCSLLTLEGPNGYGKTTVFDAIELALTGGISRITDLCDTVMGGSKTRYSDNLYWNVKGGEKDLKIKIEISSTSGNEHLCFARVATVADLKLPNNNKANKFDIFKLYALTDFRSDALGEILPSNHIDSLFGESFSKNYSMLNYLQQGQSNFIFAKSIASRKAALNELLKTHETKEQISLCLKVEKRLTSESSSAAQQKLAVLKEYIDQLSKIDSSQETLTEYKKISSCEPTPSWDLVDPFLQLDEARYRLFIADLDLLAETLARKDEVRVRFKNADIERYIAEKDKLLSVAVSVGRHIDRYEVLKAQHQRLATLVKVLLVLAKSPNTITIEDLVVVKASGSTISDSLEPLIVSRNELVKLLNGKSAKILELNQLRADLFKKHKQAFDEEGTHCALCGVDWETVEKLAQAISDTTKVYENDIGAYAARLQEIHSLISITLDPIKNSLTTESELLEKIFEGALYTELGKNLNTFEELRRLNARLTELKIEYSEVFSDNSIELASRKEKLVTTIRDLKQIEGEAPPVGWERIIKDTFAKTDDFYTMERQQVLDKRNYITLKYRQLQNVTLQAAKQDFTKQQNAINAAIAAKERISLLKNLLTRTERDYSARIISNIELIFHIYSGRLIQNYQRGLGLFIDYGDGNKIQFCTAERSEHDATLSMSSGQLSALSLSFFFSLNRVYSESAFVLIDDPAQSLDEINIASLTDLLRCELKDRQLIISSHEDDIAGYMRYRFNRADLTQKPFHMQTHADGGAASVDQIG